MKPIYNLINLADFIVPEPIKQNSPQFYELIRAFLRNLESVQTSINSNFLDTIDYNKIQNTDFQKIILDIYLSTLDLKNEPNLAAIGNVIDISKDLGLVKGTVLIYEILVRLLLIIVPGIGTQYNLLVVEYNNPLTTPVRKRELETEILQIEYDSYINGIVKIKEVFDSNGNIIPFMYETVIDLDILYYEKYIRPFAHISGWEETFIWGISPIMIERIEMYDVLNIYDTFDFPVPPIDGSIVYDSLTYPDSIYAPALLGVSADYSTIAGLIYNKGNLYDDGTNVYYIWDLFKSTESTIIENENIIIKSPAYDSMIPILGGYNSDTHNTGTLNGSLSCGSIKLTYKIIHQNKILIPY